MFVVRKSHVFDKMSGRFPGVFEATTANLFPVGFAAREEEEENQRDFKNVDLKKLKVAT